MTAPGDSILEYWKENREQFRQSENQRAVLTNFLMAITAGVSGFIVQQHFALRTLPLSVLIIIMGIYGAIASAKYHERADYHLLQARALTRALMDDGVLADHRAILNQYRQEHYRNYPKLHRVRLYWLWIGLHIGIVIYGCVLLVTILLA